MGYSQGDLRNMKSIAERFEMSVRTDKLSWRHHYEVALIKKVEEISIGKKGRGECRKSTLWRTKNP